MWRKLQLAASALADVRRVKTEVNVGSKPTLQAKACATSMEWSLHIAGASELNHPPEVPGDIERLFGPVQFTRIAYGTEFCETPAAITGRAQSGSGEPAVH